MYRKKECIAMLLAGGQGSRLHTLTKKVAKPAVPFGGKYKIIDFTLSNCINSGIDTVGVLTQYEPHSLNAYVGTGQPWDLDRLNGGVSILPPYQRGTNTEWYKGTANAIYQNERFINEYNPEYVLVLSGDHIYKMDYSKMLEQHKKTNADVTIAVLDVPLEEASRFGIMNCYDDGTIYEFEEKPKNPKSTLASMGIYIFNWDKLRKYLKEDEENKDSKNDFGQNIIPLMLEKGELLMSYKFEGYWKDVGTINSLWEASMDIISPESSLSLDDDSWVIYSRNTGSPPHFLGAKSSVKHSLVSEGCEIDGNISNSVLFRNVTVGTNAKIDHSVIMPGVIIEDGAEIYYSIVASDAHIKSNAKIGGCPEDFDKNDWGISVIASDITIDEDVIVKPNKIIEESILNNKAGAK